MQENLGKMSPSQILLSFDGRINRAKFWLYSLLLMPIWLIGLIIDLSTIGEIGGLYWFAVIVCFWPSLALNVKRCHDRNKSGWFYLVAFIPIVSLWYLVEPGFLKGTDGDNRFGSDPLSQVIEYCIHCGTKVNPDYNFCINCGKVIEYCIHCGTQMNPDYNFCINCGKALRNIE